MSKPDFLYDLLPIIYRQRDLAGGARLTHALAPDIPGAVPQPGHALPVPVPDAGEQAGALRALFTILQRQYDLLEQDIASLYDNWFAETCEPWVLPYIGDLVAAGRAVRGAHPAVDTRSLVANTIAYRRRNGLATTIERAVEDVTGWPARVGAFADLLAMTETARCPRGSGGTIGLRDGWKLACLGGAFDAATRTADVRRAGRYGLERAGIFVWRLQSYPLRRVSAGKRSATHHDRLTFHPLGRDMPLFNRRLYRGSIERPHDAGVRAVPGPLARRMTAEDLAGTAHPGARFFDENPAFAIYPMPAGAPIAKEKLVIADLGEWKWPPGGARHDLIAIDPERGRILLGADYRDRAVATDHCYGFAGDIGGGPYFKPESFDSAPPPIRLPTKDGADLASAITKAAGPERVIEIVDSATYKFPQTIKLAGAHNRSLVIRAAAHQRPCLTGPIAIEADAPNCSLVLEGLLLEGPIHTKGALALTLRHCTMVPPRGGIAVAADTNRSDGLRIVLQSSIVGPLRVPAEAKQLTIFDSILDGGGRRAVGSPRATDEEAADARLHHAGPPLVTARTTFFGEVAAAQIEASDAIFTAPVTAVHGDRGFVRHCFVPAGSRTPQRFRCEPHHDAGPPVRPIFTSMRFGHPGYAQLAPNCPGAIAAGAAAGGEMGAFHQLGAPWRAQGLHDVLADYLPFGLAPHVIYAT